MHRGHYSYANLKVIIEKRELRVSLAILYEAVVLVVHDMCKREVVVLTKT